MMKPDHLLQTQDLRVEFPVRRGIFRSSQHLAVDGVDMRVGEGETVGLVGESGSGKSTLARAVLRLIRPGLGRVSGRVLFRNRDVTTMSAAELSELRQHLQLVFQDPLAALNPRMSIGDALQEPLKIYRPALTAAERASLVETMLLKVGLSASSARRYPRQFSGGQCQRIGIARAMILRPDLLICDEPVSALDVSIQGQIVNLLTEMRSETGAAMIFISHNLAVVRHISQRVYVMYRGRIVESAPCAVLFASPRHPYTRALIAAIPTADSARSATPAAAVLEVGVEARGCAFRDRCVHAAPACGDAVPALQSAGPEQWVACLRFREI